MRWRSWHTERAQSHRFRMYEMFTLDVDTKLLTKSLIRLKRAEKRADRAFLSFGDGYLCLQLGAAGEFMPADGEWHGVVSVGRGWVEALVKNPVSRASVSLTVRDGRLLAREYAVSCLIESTAPRRKRPTPSRSRQMTFAQGS